MKNISFVLIWYFLFLFAITSFTYADNKSDVEAIYADKISSIESQMNRAYSDLEAIYVTSITNAQARLKDVNDIIKKIQDNYSFQLDLAINAFKSSWVVLSESELQSMAVDSIRWLKTQVDAQIDAQEKLLTQITAQIKWLHDEKVSKLAQSKNQYQVKIDALISERNILIDSLSIQSSNSGQVNIVSNSGQVINNITSSNQSVIESNKLKCPVNSYDIYNGNGAYISCKCNQGFDYNSSGLCISKNKWAEESCKTKHWANSSDTVLSNWVTVCSCNSWYTFSASKLCITEKEKIIEDAQLKKDSYSIAQELNDNKNTLFNAMGQGQIQTTVTKPVIQDDTTIYPYIKRGYEVKWIKKVNEFRKSKILKVNSKFKEGTSVKVYKMWWGEYWTKIWTVIVWKKWIIKYSLKTPGTYIFLE